MDGIAQLNDGEIEQVQGGVWVLLAAVGGATYAAVEIGRALHGAFCDDHPERK